MTPQTSSRPVIAVIGAGQMGRGIAQVCACAGYRVLLADQDYAISENAQKAIAISLEKLADRGSIQAKEASNFASLICPVAGFDGFGDAQLVIEAATEREEIKRQIFKSVVEHLSPEAVLATNTSSISITGLAASVAMPSSFLGIHFFNPVPKMKLVEIIKGLHTSNASVERVIEFVNVLGKRPILVSDSPGFAVNRILIPMLNEACFALGEGVASAHDIDEACRLGLNHPMGPLELADMVGLDTCLEICRVLQSATGDQKYRPAPILVKYVEAGRLGRKVKRGFFEYED